jgi:hypothetical protein
LARSFPDDPVLDDITEALLSRWSNLTITLPLATSSHDLVAYFKMPLEEDEKMPLSHYNMSALVLHGQPAIRCSEGDLRRIFRFSIDEESEHPEGSLSYQCAR